MSSGQATEQTLPPVPPEAAATTGTEVVEVSFALLLSAMVFETDAVLEIVLPGEAVPATEYVARKTALSSLFKLEIVHVVVPVVPGVGLLQAKLGPLN